MATLSLGLAVDLSAGRHKLLLADDSVAIQKVVQLTFTDEGYEVAISGNGVEALRLLEEFRPAVMLVDVSMPGLNGYEVCRRIRRDERFKHLPVLLLVGIFEPFDPKEAREAGADDVLTKPFQSIREMLNKVGAYLTGRPYEEEPEYDSRPLRIDAPPVTSQTVAPPPQPVAHEKQAENLSSVEPASAAFSGADPHAAAAMPEEPAEELAREPVPSIPGPSINATDSVTTGELDERTVEVKPPVDFADNNMSSSSAPAVETFVNDESALMASTADTDELKPTNMESQMSLSSDRYPEPAFGSTLNPPSAPRTSSSDDSLLDLGETPLTTAASSSVPTISDQDDMILDLGDEPVYAAPAASRSQNATAGGGAGNSSLSAEQLSPEIIDAIARRVAEHLSTRAIEDVAWEVVPQLAELLIKQQLEAGKARKM